MATKEYNLLASQSYTTGMDLWRAMTDRDFNEVYKFHKENSRRQKIGRMRSAKILEATNLIKRFAYRQNKFDVKCRYAFDGNKKYSKPLPNPKNWQEIWLGLTDLDYQTAFELYCLCKRQKR